MRDKRKQNKLQLMAITVLAMFVLICSCVYISATAYTERPAMVSADGSNVNVRSGPGTTGFDVLGSLADKTLVTIIGEDKASDGSLWYKIRCTINGATVEGYMHSAYLVYTYYDGEDGLDDVEKMTFEELLAQFPASYKTPLLILHDMYPNWKFVPQYTNLKWSDVLTAESTKGRSLVSSDAISSWKSTADGAYDWNTSTWYGKDGEKWVTASEEIVAYYLDPRNYLDGSMIFAFITHEYDAAEQNIDGVRSIIGQSFMAAPFVDTDGVTRDYATVLMEAAQAYKVSPYVLAAMIRIEIGYNGDSASISGTVPGLENLFNYYNVGAYKDGNWETANQRGLWYAGGEGVGNTSYGRPWNTRYKSLMGGAEFYATNYVGADQNTLYLKRFNVMSDNPYTHQYMTNIQGAASEANVYSLAYNAEAKQQNLVFYIPIYDDMPETACVKPTKTGSPNNKLDSITVDGAVVSGFNMDTTAYRVEVSSEVEKIVLGAAPKDGTAVISGTGEKALAVGENHYTISVKAQNGDVRAYAVTIVRPVANDTSLSALSVAGYELSPVLSSGVYDYSVTIPAEVNQISVTATATSKQATVEISGKTTDIPFGQTVISVKVTAGDQTTVAEYRIQVNRLPANDATLSALSVTGLQLDQAFDPAVYEYSVTIPAEQTTVEVIAAASSSLASVEITGNTTEIPFGQSVITVKVTAGDQTTVAEYHIQVTRLEATDATLSALSVTGLQLAPAFDPAVYEYSMIIPAEQTAVEVIAAANSSLASVEITGAAEIAPGQSVITVKVTAGNGTTVNEYHITVERPAPNENVTVTSEFYTIGEDKYITGLTEQPVTAETMLANLAVTGGTAQITAADGVTAVTNVGTGTLVKVYDEAGVLCDVYTVVIYGDVNGDGVIDDLDFLRILKAVMGYSEQTGVYAISADINRNGMVDDIDFLRMLKYVMGYPNSNIVQ